MSITTAKRGLRDINLFGHIAIEAAEQEKTNAVGIYLLRSGRRRFLKYSLEWQIQVQNS